MKNDKNSILEQFLKNSAICEKLGLSEEEVDGASFIDKSENVSLEALKAMITSTCNQDSDTVVLRNINLKIQR